MSGTFDDLETDSTTAIYVLDQDVTNPKPDKRVRYDWTKWKVWPKGMRFEIETSVSSFQGKTGQPVEIIHKLKGLGNSITMSMGRHPAAFEALRPHLKPLEATTLDDLLAKHHTTHERILVRLLDSGDVTMGDVRDLLEPRDIKATKEKTPR